jgi:GT2 family glycosyltransferase
MSVPKVGIIILTINALKMTQELLRDVAKLNTKGIEAKCIVVDNDSKDGTQKVLKDWKLKNMDYKFIEAGKNLGFAGGNNLGIKDALKSGCSYVILINNDLVLSKDLVTKLVEFMDQNPDIGMASPKMYFAKGYEFHKERYSKEEIGKVFWYAGGIIDWNNILSAHRGVDEVDIGQYNQVWQTDFVNGACVIIRREVFDEIGFLDSSLFLYWEDADFSQRAKKAGFKVVYFPDTCVWHKVSTSTGGSGSSSNDYFLVRNRFYFALRYARFRVKMSVLRDTFRLALVGRPWQRKGAIDALLGVKGMGAWAKH